VNNKVKEFVRQVFMKKLLNPSTKREILPRGGRSPIPDPRLGFTLIELLVVIAVTVMLSSYLVSYNRSSQRQIILYVEQQKIANLIFKAKSLAIESFIKTEEGNCGYGLAVNYSARNYSIFYYATSTVSDQPKLVQCSEIKKNGANLDQIRTLSDTTSLNSNLVFKSPEPTDALYYVLFVPPDPQTIIVDKNGDLLSDPGTIYLQTGDGSAQAVVTVNLAGQVNF